MLNNNTAQLDFLGLHKDEVDWVSFPALAEEWQLRGFHSWGEVLLSELSQELDTFFSGKTVWQANPGDACEWCAVRGVCRPESLSGFATESAGEEGDDE
jgi:ATP-dependent helicase/nuclease subunit B